MTPSVVELQAIYLFFMLSGPPLHPSVMVTHGILNCGWFCLWPSVTEGSQPSVRGEYYLKCENY